jgi:hypothetical protein
MMRWLERWVNAHEKLLLGPIFKWPLILTLWTLQRINWALRTFGTRLARLTLWLNS